MTIEELPTFTMQEMIDAGVHYGHRISRLNPKVAPYIYGSRNGISIINLQKTYPMLCRALDVIYKTIKNNGRLLMVGTKKQAREAIKREAELCGQYYVNNRWPGGLLTNLSTISGSLKTLFKLEEEIEQN